ncbi:hypothetical protein IW140_004603 [Coemansia sp. RSA 1813]|nr:hypothetical protein EV178_002161 [Coemansia sp. RSA 1646]KAJ1767441.1 hypothetical protein LPJ74_005355 [Coemansia sp. RSA 1843]KAJ2090339.1 hypothetical protein IW138_002765 [Coemansia sp. RSA 986]KAJ2215526.1 hypothetical protein EV179_002119 [Coemansia sp. RSA 487]KAJ2567178.1 hypothetical protein IW140_004603 [Coemansia sp. RSA 1813]
MSSAQTTSATTAAADEFPHKVFVGNLSFSTTEGELKDFFSDVADVVDASIITRGPRSLGYGFVAFADEATLQKVTAAKNGKELGGRTINVESARPITEESLAAKKEKAANRRRNRKPKGKGTEETSTGDEKPQRAEQDRSDSSPREGKRRPRRFPRRSRNGERAAEGSDAAAPAAPKKDTRKPSDTVAFIGNLPFTTTDEELSKLFSDFSISSARIVVNKKSMRPKGFGFVTFSSPADQANAIARYTAQPLTANDRELSIKAALSDAPVASENESA